MSPSPRARSCWAGPNRPSTTRRPLPAALAGLGLLAAVTTALAGCTNAPAAAPGPTDAAGVVQQLGQVPIPTAPAAAPTPTASPGHPQLLAIGAPVRVTLPGGVSAVVTALGPDVVLPSNTTTPPQTVTGTITITATSATGALALHAADFSSRDETGQAVPLAASGPASATASGGQPATLKLTGTFRAGAAQVTWRTAGTVVAIWDFNIETD
ncbi:hypothetical protein [Saccharopolyspora phatthalungensis]|uniref:Uncharacterized protein n=1 Tax=Saccharopolyspora phatthalungensis TaxID=664693 RepID=A0A840Q991_9PSEU|nr:hypothetical protein [Saccharopolyspora phatthalungensis]MBB5156497.1 hypothetical protein [Saccharopolyspora phatthalungensis]